MPPAMNPTILIVEDDTLMRMHGVDILESAGFTVLEAESADDAIDILQSDSKVDLVFTDIDMPGSMDGIELAAIVGEEWPLIRSLITSSHRNIDREIPAVREIFVSKPWNETALVDRINLALQP